MNRELSQAFSMLELIFVIAIVGILSTIAISKLYINRDDAIIVNTKNTISSLRSAMAIEKQRRILNSKFKNITTLTAGTRIFGGFDGDIALPVLDFGVTECTSDKISECWKRSGTSYVFVLSSLDECKFEISDNRLVTSLSNPSICDKLEQ